MKLGYALLADAAQVGPNGKLSMIGGNIDTIYATGYPALVPALSLVIFFDVEEGEDDKEHQLRLRLLGSDQVDLIPIGLEHPFTPTSAGHKPELPLKYLMVVTLNGMVIPLPNLYEFRCVVDGQDLGGVRLMAEVGTGPSAHPLEKPGGEG